MALHYLKYQSMLRQPLTAEQFEELLTKARHHNGAHQISGLLLCRNGQCVQILEGEEAALRLLYAKIQRDPRHHALVVLADEPLPARNFGAWAMAFR